MAQSRHVLLYMSLLLLSGTLCSFTHMDLDRICSDLWTKEVNKNHLLPVCSKLDYSVSFVDSVLSASDDVVIGYSTDAFHPNPTLDTLFFTNSLILPASIDAVVAVHNNQASLLLSPRSLVSLASSVPGLSSSSIDVGLAKHIYILILDSTSRISLSTFAPGLSSHISSSTYTQFSRFSPSTPGGTRATLFPLLYGGVPASCPAATSSDYARLMNFRSIASQCTSSERRLFDIAKQQGRVTGYLDMTRSKQYVYVDEGNLDYVVPNLPYESLFHSNKGAGDNICVGDKLGAELVLDYARDILKASTGSPRGSFIVSHLSGAHESPSHLLSLDTLVTQHLREVEEMLGNDGMIIVMGDHGLVDIHCDYRRPFLAIRTPQFSHVLDNYKHMRVSPYDLYTTLKYALTSQDQPFSHSIENELALLTMPLSKYDKNISFSLSSLQPINLLSMTSPIERECESAGIASVICDDPSEITKTQEAFICGDPPANLPRSPGLSLDHTKIYKTNQMGDAGLFSWCQQYMKVAEQCVNHLNSLLPPTIVNKGCRRLELGFLESGVLDHSTGVYDLIVHIHTNGGLEGTFKFSVSDMDTQGILSMRLMQFKQLTRFSRHEPCTPERVDPEICFCN